MHSDSHERKTKDQKVERQRSVDPQLVASLRSRINRFAQDHEEEFAKGCTELPEQFDDREQDNAEPLLTVAKCLGGDWYQQALEAVISLSEEPASPKSASNQLMEDIREVLRDFQGRYIPTADLLAKLTWNEEMDWSLYNHGQGLTSRQLARYVGAYGIKPKTVRMKDGSTPKGYEVPLFEEVFKRYLPEIVPETEPEEAEVDRFKAGKEAELEALRSRVIPVLLRAPGQGLPPPPDF